MKKGTLIIIGLLILLVLIMGMFAYTQITKEEICDNGRDDDGDGLVDCDDADCEDHPEWKEETEKNPPAVAVTTTARLVRIQDGQVLPVGVFGELYTCDQPICGVDQPAEPRYQDPSTAEHWIEITTHLTLQRARAWRLWANLDTGGIPVYEIDKTLLQPAGGVVEKQLVSGRLGGNIAEWFEPGEYSFKWYVPAENVRGARCVWPGYVDVDWTTSVQAEGIAKSNMATASGSTTAPGLPGFEEGQLHIQCPRAIRVPLDVCHTTPEERTCYFQPDVDVRLKIRAEQHGEIQTIYDQVLDAGTSDYVRIPENLVPESSWPTTVSFEACRIDTGDMVTAIRIIEPTECELEVTTVYLGVNPGLCDQSLAPCQIDIRATVLNQYGDCITGAEVTADIVSPTGQVYTITLPELECGVYVETFHVPWVVTSVGDWVVTAKAEYLDKTVTSDPATFTITMEAPTVGAGG
ncbi:MAG: hypothetical protein DRO11_09950 [Methanobacteriota archaeon]|nr:MAG: hypothetical protein DRO11_09950 [Euryarchaeota archaeon]